MPISQGGKGLRTKHSVWVGPSFVFICEVTREPRPRQAIDPAIRPRQGDLAKMAASEAAPVPQRSWALSLGRLLPPRRGDCSSLVFLTGQRWWHSGASCQAEKPRERGMRGQEAGVPWQLSPESPGSQASLFQAKSSSGEATSGM